MFPLWNDVDFCQAWGVETIHNQRTQAFSAFHTIPNFSP